MSTADLIGELRIVMHGISWETYEALADNPERAGRRITYDRGEMEIMSPSRSHEIDKSMLGRMIEMYCFTKNIDASSSASTTFKRRDLERGFEPDASFYIRNESVVRSRGESDLSIDPPPDLVVEIERSRSALNKLALFAEFGVPEVWRYNGHVLWVGVLRNETYVASNTSESLAGFPIALAESILQDIGTTSETKLIRRFVEVLST